MSETPTTTGSSPRKVRKLFAVRLSQTWVELRSSTKVIKGVKSTVVKAVPHTKWKRIVTRDALGWPLQIDMKEVTSLKKIKLTTVHWIGGRNLGVFRASKFYLYFQLPRTDEAVEVHPPVRDLFLNARWRKKHL